MNRSILLVFAHPDDESFGLGGTVAKYTAHGLPVDLICATRGEKGTRVGIPNGIDTGTVREAELRTAASIMGIRRIFLLGYADGEVANASSDEIASKITNIMKELQPEVVISFGPDGITGHPDHIAISRAATEAFRRLKTGGYTRKLYYVTIPESAFPDSADSSVTTRPDGEVTTVIDISAHIETKIMAVSAHKSQQDIHDFIEMLRDSGSPFARSEYLYLADSVPGTKETDLFQ